MLSKGIDAVAKIHIMGAPGSGKTTLAQDISSRLHIPHYDLDKISLQQESPVALASRPAWVTEGIYLITTEPMLYHADYIIVLKISWPVAAWRILRRHLLNSLRDTQSYPGIKGIKALFALLKGARRYCLNLDHTGKFSVEDLHLYLEAHRDIAEPPTEEFMKMYLETYRDIFVPPTEKFVQRYLDRYKEKVLVIKNVVDRERVFELLADR